MYLSLHRLHVEELDEWHNGSCLGYRATNLRRPSQHSERPGGGLVGLKGRATCVQDGHKRADGVCIGDQKLIGLVGGEGPQSTCRVAIAGRLPTEHLNQGRDGTRLRESRLVVGILMRHRPDCPGHLFWGSGDGHPPKVRIVVANWRRL